MKFRIINFESNQMYTFSVALANDHDTLVAVYNKCRNRLESNSVYSSNFYNVISEIEISC